MTPDKRRLNVIEVCDAFNVPPHVVDPTVPPHRYTWRIRRWARIWRKRLA